MSVCPTAENAQASGPVSAAISFRSAPTEKLCSPEITSGDTGDCEDAIFRISSVSAITFRRVRRFMPSAETRVRNTTPHSRLIMKVCWLGGGTLHAARLTHCWDTLRLHVLADE